MMPFKRVKPALGTFFEITLKNVSSERGIALTSYSFNEVYRLEKIFNVFDPKSELSLINRSILGTKFLLSDELFHVLSFGQEAEIHSTRAFRLMPLCEHDFGKCYELGSNSVTRLSPCQFDLGGIAKGFIVDCIFNDLRERSPEADIFINAGGDLRCHGEEIIELRVPTLGDEKCFAINNFKGAMATSSLLGEGIARYSTSFLRGPFDPSTVTVGTDSCMSADTVTKVLLFAKSVNQSLDPTIFPTIFSLSFNSLGCTL